METHSRLWNLRAAGAVLAAAVLVARTSRADTGVPEPSLARRLIASYEAIKTVTCEIEKTTITSAGTVRLLSRVHFRSPNCIHVENVSPQRRLIIADGRKLYYHEEHARFGFSRPIADLTGKWLDSLHNIPGTPLDNLLKLKNLPEVPVAPMPDYPQRAAYAAKNVFVVLSCDATGRLARLEFFESPDMKKKTATYEYANYRQVGEHCWIPLRHKASLALPDGGEITETRLILNLEVNTPIPDSLFAADLFFKGVDFVDDFDKTYASP